MATITTGINDRIATQVKRLRIERSLTLEALAEASGVSRSMISLVERGESSATAVVLERLATGLGVSLATLFDEPVALPAPVSLRANQVEWCDPASGYLRRNVSPGGFPSPIQIVEVVFPAGARVAYETAARPRVTHQQIWVLRGVIEIALGDDRYELRTGDCLAMVLDRPVTFHNRTTKPVHYCVVIASGPP